MEKKFNLIVNCETQEETLVEFTAEEYAAHDAFIAAETEAEAERVAAEEALAALKASAKAKLVAGEPLTAEEANTLVI